MKGMVIRMIEVMFGESEGGSMKIAKKCRKPDGEPFGGNSSEVVCIPLMLELGDISLPVDSDYRKNLISEMHTINGMFVQSSLTWLKEAWIGYQKELGRLKNYAATGEELRIWYSDAPYSACGLRYVCSLLREYDCRVSVIKLPPYILLTDDTIQTFVSWNEFDAGRFYQFLPLEKKLSAFEIRLFASDWTALTQDNSMLRAVVNGRLIGVPEDFYDHIIRKEIPEGEFMMARLLGDALGKHPLGVSDSWYAKRIIWMIEQGELEIIHKHTDTYRQILKKV